MRLAAEAVAPSKGGATVVGLYEEIRRWVLDPSREMPSRPPSSGLAVLLRSGMREWMATISSLQSASHQTTTANKSSAPAPPTSIQEQLRATLASIVLSLHEVPHES